MNKLDEVRPLDNKQEWQERWLRSDLPAWDLKGPHPLLGLTMKYAKELGLLPDGAKIVVPACGRAHDGASLVLEGFNVRCEDIVEEAIGAAKELYKDLPGLELKVGNSLLTDSSDVAQWDMIFDRAALCAFSGEIRQSYVNACLEKLKVGGLFTSISFSEVGHGRGGPPFAISLDEIKKLFEDRCGLVKLEYRTDGSVDSVIKEEVIHIWRKGN